jgi:hypothetical protein
MGSILCIVDYVAFYLYFVSLAGDFQFRIITDCWACAGLENCSQSFSLVAPRIAFEYKLEPP